MKNKRKPNMIVFLLCCFYLGATSFALFQAFTETNVTLSMAISGGVSFIVFGQLFNYYRGLK